MFFCQGVHYGVPLFKKITLSSRAFTLSAKYMMRTTHRDDSC